MGEHKERILFIHQLRAIATIMVMLWHLTIMFWYSNETISVYYNLKPIVGGSGNLSMIYTSIISALMNLGLDFGRFGVAIFFLISGYIIPYSIKENLSIKNKLLFLIKRILRIWPTYVCGFTISFIALYAYSKFHSEEFMYTIKDYFIQISLLRDFFWKTSIDGISWTLEVELKFYIFIFILLLFNRLYSKKIIILSSIGMTIFNILFFANAQNLLMNNLRLYQIGSVVSDSFIYIIFTLFGLAIYNLSNRKWNIREMAVVFQVLLIAFVISILNSANNNVIRNFLVNYFSALILFVNFYFLRNHIRNSLFLNFFAEKSFAIYLIHGTIGYVMLSTLYEKGINVHMSILGVISLVLCLASLFNRYVEKPINKIATYTIQKLN